MGKHTIIIPTPEEDAIINAGIAADPDTSEADEDFFARAKPADPKMMALTKRYRGEQISPTKVATSIRLSPEVLDAYKAGGKGWQSRINNDLLAIVRGPGKKPRAKNPT